MVLAVAKQIIPKEVVRDLVTIIQLVYSFFVIVIMAYF